MIPEEDSLEDILRYKGINKYTNSLYKRQAVEGLLKKVFSSFFYFIYVMDFETKDWKKFKRFLKDRGLFSAYCYNYRKQTSTRDAWLARRGKKYITELDPKEYVNYAFSWDRTEQKHMFWEDIDNIWKLQVSGWRSWNIDTRNWNIDTRSW